MFLDVRDLTITLKTGEEIAKDISFSIDGGEMLSIVGSSGAGKTTVRPLRMSTKRKPLLLPATSSACLTIISKAAARLC